MFFVRTKRVVLFMLILSASVLSAACQTVGISGVTSSSSLNSSNEESSRTGSGEGVNTSLNEPDFSIDDAPADLNDLTDITNTYVRPLNDDCLFYSWAKASEIIADDLIGICAYNNLLKRSENLWDPMAEVVEVALQQHFDVDADYLRTSSRYNAKMYTYSLHSNDREAGFRAISAMQKGNRIGIEVGLTVPSTGEIEDRETTLLAGYAAVNYKPYREGRLIFPSGTLTVELTSDNIVKFVSYKCSETFQKETDKLKLYEKYAHALVFDLGRNSWSSAKEIEPDALVNFYIYLSGTGEVTMPEDGLREVEYGNPYMLGDELEKVVMKHFDVTPEHIRKSEFYDRDRKAYWSGGIGSTVDMEIVGAKQVGKLLTLTLKESITSSDYNAYWGSEVFLEVDGDNYKYISYTREDATIE